MIDWSKEKFPLSRLSSSDMDIAIRYVPDLRQAPDLIIAPDGKPYMFRWHVAHNQGAGNVYFHMQVADDPERPLHDHPWDNMSVILSGGYLETLQPVPPYGLKYTLPRRAGDVIFRKATEAHRLFIPEGVPYTLTQFSTGPRVRTWGFWFPDGWQDFRSVTTEKDGVSIHTGGKHDATH